MVRSLKMAGKKGKKNKKNLIKLVSKSGYTYYTFKNPKNVEGKLTRKKYDPKERKHVEFNEKK
jgi:large subunit ribosomal protein L33